MRYHTTNGPAPCIEAMEPVRPRRRRYLEIRVRDSRLEVVETDELTAGRLERELTGVRGILGCT